MRNESLCPECECELAQCALSDNDGVPIWYCEKCNAYWYNYELKAEQEDVQQDDEAYEHGIQDDDWFDQLHTAETIRWALG
jgi:Zn-finger nucleic acid-binding protein